MVVRVVVEAASVSSLIIHRKHGYGVGALPFDPFVGCASRHGVIFRVATAGRAAIQLSCHVVVEDVVSALAVTLVFKAEILEPGGRAELSALSDRGAQVAGEIALAWSDQMSLRPKQRRVVRVSGVHAWWPHSVDQAAHVAVVKA